MTVADPTTAAVAQIPFNTPFALEATDGVVWRFPDASHPGPTVIVFFRGHWCPYCRRYLSKVQLHNRQFVERDTRLLAISPEPLDSSRQLASELQLGFPILSDSDGQVIDSFGVRNRYMGFGTLLPHPAVFVFDRDHRLAMRSVDRNYKRRTTLRTILRATDLANDRRQPPARAADTIQV